MNHDYAHCADYTDKCPKKCFRGALVRDVNHRLYPFPVSWMHLEGTEECMKERTVIDVRLIDADALMADCQLAQKQADRHGREFANAFYSGGGEISTEWWCVEDMIENAPTIEKRKKGEWIEAEVVPKAFDVNGIGTWASKMQCDQCGFITYAIEGHMGQYNFCPNCGADMRESHCDDCRFYDEECVYCPVKQERREK